MGKIIKDGVEHFFFGGGSGSGDNIEIMTRAEYDALVEAGTVDADVVYFITDAGEGSGGNASDVVYDNTESGLTATDVQGAVDELNKNFQDGVNTIVSAVNTKAGTSLTGANTPTEIAEVIENIKTGEFRKIISNQKGTNNSTSPYWTITDYLSNYQDLTIDNFIVQLRGITQNADGTSRNDGWTYSYDSSLGRVIMYVPDTFNGHTAPHADIFYVNF